MIDTINSVNPMFYTRVPLELSQLVVTLDCIYTRKLNLFCLSNIVFYRLYVAKMGVSGSGPVANHYHPLHCLHVTALAVPTCTASDMAKHITEAAHITIKCVLCITIINLQFKK